MYGLILTFAIGGAIPVGTAEPDHTFEELSSGEWFTYEVSAIDPRKVPCCFECKGIVFERHPCRLDEETRSMRIFGDRVSAGDGEALRIFIRRGRTGLDRVVVVGTRCPIDTQSERITRISGVATESSVRFFERALSKVSNSKMAQDVLFVIAQHGGVEATEALVRLSMAERPWQKDVYFWLAQLRGRPGFEAVRKAIERGPSEELGPHLVFCISQSPLPEMREELKRIARKHSDERLRGEALFWLAERHDAEVESIGLASIDQDPSMAVRKRAIFAIAQLPADRAIDTLKRVIHSDRPREIRREALFWLGQQDDDRALAEFDTIFGDGPR